jgi:hypothetical protein
MEARKEMERSAQIERRIVKIKQALADLGDMRPGSLSTQTRSWGGQYCQLSYTHLGKGRTEYVPQERLNTVRQQLANHNKFKDLVQEWVALAIEFCKLKATQDQRP